MVVICVSRACISRAQFTREQVTRSNPLCNNEWYYGHRAPMCWDVVRWQTMETVHWITHRNVSLFWLSSFILFGMRARQCARTHHLHDYQRRTYRNRLAFYSSVSNMILCVCFLLPFNNVPGDLIYAIICVNAFNVFFCQLYKNEFIEHEYTGRKRLHKQTRVPNKHAFCRRYIFEKFLVMQRLRSAE